MQALVRYLQKRHHKQPERAKQLARLLSVVVRKPGDALLDQLINILGVEEVQKRFNVSSAGPALQRKLNGFDQVSGLQPDRRYRIAVCMSGDLRSFANTRASIERFFSGHDVDYFCHGWAGDFDESLLAEFPNVHYQGEERPNLTELEKKSIHALGLKHEKGGLKRVRLSLYVFPMWYGIKSAFGLMEKQGKSADDYDLVCRCRYDNFFIGQLSQMPGMPDDKTVVIDPNYNGYGAYADQFAIGRPAVMRQYFQLFDWLDQALDTFAGAERLTAEELLKEYLEQQCGLQVDQIDFGLRLLRNDFVGMAPHEIPLRSHKVSRSRNDTQSDYVKATYPELYEKY